MSKERSRLLQLFLLPLDSLSLVFCLGNLLSIAPTPIYNIHSIYPLMLTCVTYNASTHVWRMIIPFTSIVLAKYIVSYKYINNRLSFPNHLCHYMWRRCVSMTLLGRRRYGVFSFNTWFFLRRGGVRRFVCEMFQV